MRKKIPANFPSWEVADREFEAFIGELDLRRFQLRERLAATGGPELDGSLNSLTPLALWYFDAAMRDDDDGMEWWPRWLPPRDPQRTPPEGERDLSPQFVRLQELVAVYLADVILPWIPHARWVCWRSKSVWDVANGGFVVDVGDATFPFGPLWVVDPKLSLAYMQPREAAKHLWGVSPQDIETSARRKIIERDARLNGRPVTWQKAPTGPDADRRTRKPTW